MALKAALTLGSRLSAPKGHMLIPIAFQSQMSHAINEPVLPRTPLWKAAAFASGLGLSMLSYPLHAAPSSGGTVQGLYDALLNTMKNGVKAAVSRY
jgi:hypothetical protein